MQRNSGSLSELFSSLTRAANGFSTWSLSGDLKAPGIVMKCIFNIFLLFLQFTKYLSLNRIKLFDLKCVIVGVKSVCYEYAVQLGICK